MVELRIDLTEQQSVFEYQQHSDVANLKTLSVLVQKIVVKWSIIRFDQGPISRFCPLLTPRNAKGSDSKRAEKEERKRTIK